MNDNTVIEATVSIELRTEDEYNAERIIDRMSIRGLLIPISDAISETLCATQDDYDYDDEDEDEDDLEQQEQEVIDFYKAGGHGDGPIDMLTTDDYAESAE